ncbi:ATP-binding cassette domain-containing protein [Streptomyces sp. NPDC046275]|uniref:ATP-binding cassette domain-containing protein n=1 Tax=Streptomyces sp. NPDC046275 TaxID=3157201 RepID=UPI00340A3A73
MSDHTENHPAGAAAPAAAVEGVRVRYGAVTALDGVDAEFRGGVTGLLGPNGAGKTTLLSLLSTGRRPDVGTVRVLGEAVRGRAATLRVRERIGVLPQAFGHHPRFTVTEFVEYAAWLRKVPTRERRARVREVLRLVDLERQADQRMGALSGGMLRRAGIAQAMVNRPALVLLDEPTAGLDPAQRVGFRALVRDLGEHTAVVLSTHLAEDVAQVCDHVHVLLDGRMRFTGTAAALCGDRELSGPALEAGYLAVVEQSGVRV